MEFYICVDQTKPMNKPKYNRVKAELAEAGKLSTELAEYLEVHATTVSDWCTNTNQPSVQDLYRISEFLRIDVRRLLLPTRWNTDNLSAAAEEEPSYFQKVKTAPKKSGKSGTGRKKSSKS